MGRLRSAFPTLKGSTFSFFLGPSSQMAATPTLPIPSLGVIANLKKTFGTSERPLFFGRLARQFGLNNLQSPTTTEAAKGKVSWSLSNIAAHSSPFCGCPGFEFVHFRTSSCESFSLVFVILFVVGQLARPSRHFGLLSFFFLLPSFPCRYLGPPGAINLPPFPFPSPKTKDFCPPPPRSMVSRAIDGFLCCSTQVHSKQRNPSDIGDFQMSLLLHLL